MKKDGSSKSRSKTRRISKSSSPTDNHPLADALAIGHRPAEILLPQDQALFRAFQSNLLSLISHELRTPLMGILSAISVLDEGLEDTELSKTELIKMARRNAQRLEQSLAALLDLAALESGTYHIRLKEVDLARVLQRQIEAHQTLFTQYNLRCEWDASTTAVPNRLHSPILADPKKLGRAVDLCFQSLTLRAEPDTEIKVSISSSSLEITFKLAQKMESLWDAAWSQSLVGMEGGVLSPLSAFAGVLQSENSFLTRVEEGLGSEFLLIHEIMRLHGGQFQVSREKGLVKMGLILQELTSETGLRAVLTSRAFQISTELGSVALVLIPVSEEVSLASFRDQLRKHLHRTTDAVYPLPKRHRIALVMDDRKAEDIPRVMSRIVESMGQSFPYGIAHCPDDGLDPDTLLELAEMRLQLEAQSPS